MVKYSSIAVYTILNIAIFFYQGTAKEAAIPKHPSELKYSSLDWEVPLGSPFRTTLSNGLRLYIAEDNSLPLVSINGYFSTGEINDPLGKEGLGSFAVRLMRTGGTESIPSDSLDAIIDHFAISFSFSLLETGLVLNVSFLSQFSDTLSPGIRARENRKRA